MSDSDQLEQRITDTLDQFSPKQRRLARFVLENRYFASFASTSELAEKVGVSAATVVRFAQSLGYDGFPALQAAIRAEMPRYLTTVERIQKRLAEPPPADDVPQQVFYTDIQNIERTANSLSVEQLDAVLETVTNADYILVVGAGLSAAPALFLAHSLKVIGFDVRVATDGGLSLAVDTAQLRPGALLVAIDLWRYVRTTVEAVRTAREKGATVVTITDGILSPLAQAADYAFEVKTEGVAHSLSNTAVFSLLNVLIAVLSYRVPEQATESLRHIDEAYRANDLVVTS